MSTTNREDKPSSREDKPWSEVPLDSQVLIAGKAWRLVDVPPRFTLLDLAAGRSQSTSHGGFPTKPPLATMLWPGDPAYVESEQEKAEGSPPPPDPTPEAEGGPAPQSDTDYAREFAEAVVVVRLGGQPIARQETPGGPWIIEPGELKVRERVIRHLLLFHNHYTSPELEKRTFDDLVRTHGSLPGVIAHVAHSHRRG
jgi:hypothetical protein